MKMNPDSKIYVAGHKGMVGSGVVRELQKQGFKNLVVKDRKEVDLLRQTDVERLFQTEKIEFVFLAAARVGGIVANNTYPADFLYENLQIATNVIKAAADNDTKKLLFLGSSCIYPKFALQPIQEESLLTGSLEPTNEAYALAKIAGLKLCEYYKRQYGKNFISAMPTNLYGTNDNFHPTNSHVIPGMMRRFHEAKMTKQGAVLVWGTGRVRREFLHVDDLSEGLFKLMQDYDGEGTVNIGCGEDQTIAELANMMKKVTGYEGGIEFDSNRPDGTPQKLLDVSRIQSHGWKAKISLEDGLKRTYKWALENRMLV